MARVVALDRDHGAIDHLADGRLLGAVLKVGPTRGGRNPEDVLGFVFVGIFRVSAGVIAFAGDQLCVVLLETVGDILEEDEPKDGVLVLGSIHVAAELVGGEPELRFEAEVGGEVLRF